MELFKAELGIFTMIVLGVAAYLTYRQLPYIKVKRRIAELDKVLKKGPTEEERIIGRGW